MQNRPSSPPSGAGVTATGLAVAALGVAVLQGLLIALWPERRRVGLEMPLDLSIEQADRIPLFGHWIILTWVLILGGALVARLAAEHPDLFVGLGVDTRSAGGVVKSLLILTWLYLVLGVAAAVVEHLFVFHFHVTVAQYVTVATVIAGMLFAGRRRPFLHASLEPPTTDAARRRRWWANGLCVVLLTATYISWMSYERLWTWFYSLDALTTFGIDLATASLGPVLGWALVHSSAAGLVGTAVRAIERRAEDDGRPDSWRGVAIEWLAHVGVVSALLIVGRTGWVVAHDLWTHGRWIVPFEPDQRLLGVDWYWASVWKSVTAAEALWLPAVAVLVALASRRALSEGSVGS